MSIIKEVWERLWNAEEIRILVLISLCLQFFLFFLSPLRKRTGQKLLILLLWLFYLVADYVAILALGNLLRRKKEGASCHRGGVGLMAIFAPFLLLHLGGPDTITSYSIEDNELWWRHFLVLAVQVVVAFMVLLELVAIPRLRVAAAFVFIAGLVKYSERTWSLRSSSMDQLRNSIFKPGSDFVTLKYIRGTNELMPRADLPSNIDEPDQILHAYAFFKRIKPLVTDLRLSFKHYQKSTTYFWSCSASQAFKVVEIELSFLYDVLHTKAILIHGLRGCLWRFVSLGMISSAVILFLKSEKRGYAKADIIISYVLFGSALFMELISLLLIIISDWMIIALKEKNHSILKNLVVIIAKVMSCFVPKNKPRWSNSMGQYNLLSFSLRDKKTTFRWILGAVKVKELWDNFVFFRSVPVPSKLKELLFEELKKKMMSAQQMSQFEELRNSKGEKALQKEECNHLRWSIDNEFDESILLWHIATDICFHTPGDHGNNKIHLDRKIILTMSNYMVYLLIMQPSMMPDGIGKIRFQDTCASVKYLLQAVGKVLTKEEATKALLEAHYGLEDMENSWSVFIEARKLAKELNNLAGEKRWRLIRRVWLEMLGYAAINCNAYYHAKQLGQGGELLAHVMLLMAHMGIG